MRLNCASAFESISYCVIDYQKCDASPTEWKIFSLMVLSFFTRDDGGRRSAALSLSALGARRSAFDEFNNENSPSPARHQSTQITTSTRNRKNASDKATATANAAAFNRTDRRRRPAKASEKRKKGSKKYEEFRLGMRERRWRAITMHFTHFIN